ncbi:P4c precursor [Sea otter poxvirus]|uniref:P4c n=1 Tax=Sea otter poxvirus TaxID=1416741 RepID=A0A2U9QHS6_9POXV|nr:P4c precursor [Sea otter poxvirus]AWU47161.1 P4c precursor [Sea otter poxvirus]
MVDIDPHSLWSLDDKRMRSVLHFYKIVNDSWNTVIDKQTPFTRIQKKAFRNVIRDFIRYAPIANSESFTDPHAPLTLLLPKYIHTNPYYVNFVTFNNEYFKKHYDEIETYGKIRTMGEFLVYFIMAIMRVDTETTKDGRIEKVQVFENKDEKISKDEFISLMTRACVNVLWQLCSVGYANENNNIVLGLPMYWWYNVDTEKVQHEVRIPFTRDKFKDTWSKGPLYFIKYLVDNKITNHFHTNCVTFSYGGFKSTFTVSVPEFVLDGLCYHISDNITKIGHYTVILYLSQHSNNGHTYTYLCPDDQGSIVSLPCNNQLDYYNDCGSVKILNNGSNNSSNTYGYKSLLITPDTLEHFQFEDSPHKYDDIINDIYIGPPIMVPTNYNNNNININNCSNNMPCNYSYNCIVEPPKCNNEAIRRLDLLNAKISGYIPLIRHLKDMCHRENNAAKKLEEHIETMRQYMIMTSQKVDHHTCRQPSVSVPKHSINNTFPSIKDSELWKHPKMCYKYGRHIPLWMVSY